MANYIETSTGRYPISETQIRAENPQTSFPAVFAAPEGFEVVFPAPTPAYDAMTQYVVEVAPVLTSKGHYEQAYEVRDLSAEQIAENQARAAEAFVAMVTANTQVRLDDFARTRNYDGILSACTYAASTVPKFAAEGQYCVDARDQTWATLYTLMGEVQAGARPMPTTWAEVEALLPVLAWPA